MNTMFLVILILILCCLIVLSVLLSFDSFRFFFPSSQSYGFNIMVILILFSIMMYSILFNSIISGKKMFYPQQVNYLWIAGITIVAYLVFYFFNIGTEISFEKFIFPFKIQNFLLKINSKTI